MSNKKKPKDEPAPTSRQINFRASIRLAEELDDICDALEVDQSNLVRMIIRENIEVYKARARAAREERAKGDK